MLSDGRWMHLMRKGDELRGWDVHCDEERNAEAEPVPTGIMAVWDERSEG